MARRGVAGSGIEVKVARINLITFVVDDGLATGFYSGFSLPAAQDLQTPITRQNIVGYMDPCLGMKQTDSRCPDKCTT